MIRSEPRPQFELPHTLLPPWVMDRTAPETLEAASFGSGAALSTLHLTLNNPFYGVPTQLLRDRLALEAAENCLKLQGRGDTKAEIRDAFYLTAPGNDMGPAGRMFLHWQTVAWIGFHKEFWANFFIDNAPILMKPFLDELFANPPDELIRGNPMNQAVAWASRILSEYPRQEDVALQAADIALCRALRVHHVVPLFALHIKRKDIRALLDGDRNAFAIAMHRAVAHGAQDATRLAHDLQRRAVRLKEVAPKLRSKGASQTIDLLICRDAILPSTNLSPTIEGSKVRMTSRSARRICDRLTELGVVRELTSRATFRMYGL